MQIAAVLFPRLTALDLIGPYEVLQRLPGATVTFVGHRTGEVRTENGFQLAIEYDPQPPFDSGSLAKSSKEVVERVIEYAQLKD